ASRFHVVAMVLTACSAAPHPPPPVSNTPAAPAPAPGCNLGHATTVVVAIGTAVVPAVSPVGDRPNTAEDWKAFVSGLHGELFLPTRAAPRVCLRVSRVVAGSLAGAEPCFFRASTFTLASEVRDDMGEKWGSPDEQLWILNGDASTFLWAT